MRNWKPGAGSEADPTGMPSSAPSFPAGRSPAPVAAGVGGTVPFIARSGSLCSLEQTNAEFARLFRTAVAGQMVSETDIDAEIRDIERLVTE